RQPAHRLPANVFVFDFFSPIIRPQHTSPLIMAPRDPNKPRGRVSAYAFYQQHCREQWKKKHPNESMAIAEFNKKCGDNWKVKCRFNCHFVIVSNASNFKIFFLTGP